MFFLNKALKYIFLNFPLFDIVQYEHADEKNEHAYVILTFIKVVLLLATGNLRAENIWIKKQNTLLLQQISYY